MEIVAEADVEIEQCLNASQGVVTAALALWCDVVYLVEQKKIEDVVVQWQQHSNCCFFFTLEKLTGAWVL